MYAFPCRKSRLFRKREKLRAKRASCKEGIQPFHDVATYLITELMNVPSFIMIMSQHLNNHLPLTVGSALQTACICPLSDRILDFKLLTIFGSYTSVQPRSYRQE